MPTRVRGVLAGLAAIGAVALANPGCFLARAKTTPASPPLEMPAPPPRVIETTDTTVPAPIPLIEEPARPPVRPAPRPAPRAEAAKPEAARPDSPKTEIIDAPKQEETKPAPPTTLQTTPAAAEGELERTIRAQLGRAAADLNRIDYRALNADARNQYETAKRFIQQSDDALKKKNLVFAKNLAEKAAALASQLAGR
jgi:hypothetical protein